MATCFMYGYSSEASVTENLPCRVVGNYCVDEVGMCRYPTCWESKLCV